MAWSGLPFTARPASTVNATADNSTGSTAVAITPGVNPHVRVRNAGSVDVFVEFGGTDVTAATTTGLPLGPGGVEVFGLPNGATHFAAITASGSAVVYVTPGAGV